jgi:hypothetical protein
MPIDVGGNAINSVGARVLVETNVVTSGLTCYLDAAIPACYPGSGTTMTDLSGNGNNGTLVNGPSFTGEYGGVITFDGVDDHIVISGFNYFSTNCTVIGASRYTSTSNNGRMINGNGNNWLMGHWGNTVNNFYAEGWVTGAGVGAADTIWRVYTTTNNVSGDSWGFYINGILDTQNSGGSQGPAGIRIGGYSSGGEYSTGQFASLLVYNRLLSTSEIIQNYNALRGRLGI